MSKVFIVGKKQIQWMALAMFAVMLTIAYWRWEQSKPVDSALKQERIIHIVTGEFKTQTAAGKEIEVYRWDPGTVFAKEGEILKLSIFGVNGANHQFYIEGTNIRGEVRKGKETLVQFTPKKGIYRLVCLTHPGHQTKKTNQSSADTTIETAPMVGYIVVE